MKRVFCLFAVFCLVLCTLPAGAAGVSEIMRVVNCSEWVSLRESPDTGSARLEKVRLGELVTNCAGIYNDFVYCEFNGKAGYILYKYLEPTAFTSGDGILGNQMVVDVVEYASLLDSPSASGRLLKKVPVGAVVTSCVTATGSFALGRYQGQEGYIRVDYLHTPNYGVTSQSESVVNKYTGLYPAMQGPVEVVNCTEWVSLRERASASSLRLARVPLGTAVDHCLQVSDSFVYCCYRGVWGYIGRDYLLDRGAAGYGTGNANEDEEGWHRDQLVDLSFSGGCRLQVVRGSYSGEERMNAVVTDAAGIECSRMTASDPNPGQYTTLHAFLGGTAAEPVLVWFTGNALQAYRITADLQGGLLWTLPLLDAGLCHAVDTDGTLYLIGYGSDRLTCVSPYGQLLWQKGNPDPALYWPMEIVLSQEGVRVLYEGGEGGSLLYSRSGVLLGNGEDVPEAGASCAVKAEYAQDSASEAWYRFTASREDGAVDVVYTALQDVKDFSVLAVDTQVGETVTYSVKVLCTLPVLETDKPMRVTLFFAGDLEENGIAYTTPEGTRVFWALGMSGEDGSLELRQIDPE